MHEYAVSEKTGARILVFIHCDDCNTTIKPHMAIRESGWMSCGLLWPDGGATTNHYCPECATRRHL
jgi:hypothetical protein